MDPYDIHSFDHMDPVFAVFMDGDTYETAFFHGVFVRTTTQSPGSRQRIDGAVIRQYEMTYSLPREYVEVTFDRMSVYPDTKEGWEAYVRRRRNLG